MTDRDPEVTRRLVDLAARYAERREAPPLPADLDLEALMPPWSVAKCYITWPNPRFVDTGDGTVTDNLTGLIWLDDANCFGPQTWANALAKAAHSRTVGNAQA